MIAEWLVWTFLVTLTGGALWIAGAQVGDHELASWMEDDEP